MAAGRSFGFGMLVLALVAVIVMDNLAGANADFLSEIPNIKRRSLKIFDIITKRGWTVESGLGLGFKYDEYGGSVALGPFEVTKDPGLDSTPPALLGGLLENVFGPFFGPAPTN